MPTVDQWPHNFSQMKQNKKGQNVYTFEPVEVTIRRVFPPKLDGGKMQYATGWSFNEDTTTHERGTGVIWSHPGEWNNDERAFTQAYPHPTGKQGQRASVTLSMTEGDDRNFYNLQSLVLLGGTESGSTQQEGSYADKELTAPAQEPAAALPEQFDRNGNPLRDDFNNPTAWYWLMKDEQMRVGMAFNDLTRMLASGIPDKAMTLGAEDAVQNWGKKWEQWHKWFDEASRGLPLTPVQDDEEDNTEQTEQLDF